MQLLAGEALKAYKELKAQFRSVHAALQPQVQQLQRRKVLLIEEKQALKLREETLRRQLQEPDKSKAAIRQELDQISAVSDIECLTREVVFLFGFPARPFRLSTAAFLALGQALLSGD